MFLAIFDKSIAAFEERLAQVERQIEVLSRSVAKAAIGPGAGRWVGGAGNKARAIEVTAQAVRDSRLLDQTRAQRQTLSDAIEQDLDAEDAASQWPTSPVNRPNR